MPTEEFKSFILKNRIRYIPHHNCGLCGCDVGYYFSINPMTNEIQATFDSSCDCGWSPAREIPLEEAEAWYNSLPDDQKSLIW